MEHRTDQWITIVRRLWPAAALLSVVFTVLALPGYLRWFEFTGTPLTGPAAVRLAAEMGRVLSLLCVLVSLSLAALIYWRKRQDRMALYASYFLLMYGVSLGGPLELVVYHYAGEVEAAIIIQTVFFALPMSIFLCIFPNGRFIPRWTRWLPAGSMVWALYYVLTTYALDFSPAFRQILLLLNLGTAILLPVSLVYGQILRYRYYYTPAERQQTKWVVFGIVLSFCAMGISSVPYLYVTNLPPDAPQPLWASYMTLAWWLAMSIIPVFFSLAILRSGLWDIDVIIRRTLIYSTITAILAALYFGGVAVMQNAFVALTGQESPLAVVASTLAIAALFTPVRRRVQRAVDRRFYRRKYDAEKTIDQFARAARDEVDMDRLRGELVRVVEETMQPEHVSLWVRTR